MTATTPPVSSLEATAELGLSACLDVFDGLVAVGGGRALVRHLGEGDR
ncbi:hypothetical protein FB559_5167 [Actinoallomurus bryophytorum]|uniref:Uncharacterized protein n=1 Tax=Actinoallomurus bryophytorum TaxID=1490222 RepID=A0A543CQW0_9ACTN|nr:hypothetical protein FB559_5167 [Actinoallomurus bryophytorum]